MKTVMGWWFTKEKKLPHGDGRRIQIRRTHKVKGKIVPCGNGLHLSKNILDALNYAPGNIIYRVRGTGTIIPHGNPVDKYVCSERTYIAGGVDCEKILRRFACKCALDVVHLWNAPEIDVQYLKTQDEPIWAAWEAAWAATWAAARASAWDAARKKQNRRLCAMVSRVIQAENY